MISRRITLVGAWLLLTVSLTLATVATAQTYTWKDVVQTVTIEADGDVLISDERTLLARGGDFGEAFVEVMLASDQRLTLLPEQSGAVSDWQGATAYQNRIASGQEVVVGNRDNRIYRARVRYVYRLENTLDVYSDVVQWYWNMIGLEDVAVSGYELTVNTPGPMNAPYDAFVHRYGNPEAPFVSLSEDRSSLTVIFDRIPASEGVEIRYLMDPSLFEMTSSTPGLEDLLRDEARIAGVETRRRRLETFLYAVSRRLSTFLRNRWRDLGAMLTSEWFTTLLSLLLLVCLVASVPLFALWPINFVRDYLRVGRDPPLEKVHYTFEPPSDLAPAELPFLLNKRWRWRYFKKSQAAFNATVMDLMRRGYGTLHSSERSNMFGLKRQEVSMQLNLDTDSDGLLEFEQDVLNYLKKAARYGDDPAELPFKALKSYSKARLYKFLQAWGVNVRTHLENRMGGELTTLESRRARDAWQGAGCLAPVWFVVLAIWYFASLPPTADDGVFANIMTVWTRAAQFVGVMALLSHFASHWLLAWREEVAREVYAWEGFKRVLADFGNMHDAPADFFRLWDVYYCYAAALGIAERFIRNIQQAAPLQGFDERELAHQSQWFSSSADASGAFDMSRGASDMSRGASSLADFSSSVASLSSALTAASASASSGGSSSGGSGGGGGSSSGGGGGGGGGR